ncbi:MAG: SMC-Scp complex subunit ScpB [Anaerolineales bacterium]|nr:SMC-Scp complex subunit ScpB [Anaerolineales bacterium]
MTTHAPEPLPLSALLESVLFVASDPVPVPVLANVLEVEADKVEEALKELGAEYGKRGLQILRMGDRIHITTSPRAAQIVERFLGIEHTIGLSRAALETLAILAYKQPLTRPQIDAIRGVNSESVLENLIAKDLVEEVGRTEGPGRPILYGTTEAFLRHFGLSSAADLPPLELEDPSKDDPAAAGTPAPLLKE